MEILIYIKCDNTMYKEFLKKLLKKKKKIML